MVGSKVGHENSVSKIYVYEGLQVRKNPQPFTITTNSNPVQSSMHNNPSSPILKAQLSSPAASNIIAVKKEPKSKVGWFIIIFLFPLKKKICEIIKSNYNLDYMQV